MNTIHTDTLEHEGYTITLEWFYDDAQETPWDREDGHGPVSEWTRRDKGPGERVLVSDRGSFRYYDYAEAVKIARADGWDAPPYSEGTPGQRAARAVEADFQNLRAWCNDEWCYVGYSGRIEGPDGEEIDWPDGSLWGIDSPSMEYFKGEAFEMARDYLDREISASLDAACRDIATV